MNNISKGIHLKRRFIQLIVFTVLLFSLHVVLIQQYFSTHIFYVQTWKIYCFHLITVSVLIYFLDVRSKIKPAKTLQTFVLLSLLKMIAVLVFLLPLFLNKEINSRATVLSFFIPYFLFLFFETKCAVEILNAKK